MRLTRRYSFEAAHQLHNLPAEHPCSRLHGHGYRLEVSIDGPIDERGMILEYAELDEFVDAFVLQRYDHRFINDFIDQPTVENMVGDIFDRLKQATPLVVSIRLWETERSSAEYP